MFRLCGLRGCYRVMNITKEQYLGYLKYEGELVDEGLMDARKSAQALLGFDECVRFFVCQLTPNLKNVDFEILYG